MSETKDNSNKIVKFVSFDGKQYQFTFGHIQIWCSSLPKKYACDYINGEKEHLPLDNNKCIVLNHSSEYLDKYFNEMVYVGTFDNIMLDVYKSLEVDVNKKDELQIKKEYVYNVLLENNWTPKHKDKFDSALTSILKLTLSINSLMKKQNHKIQKCS